MSEVLFEIREENLETGLRGYPVGYCTTSTVDPNKGLFYSGKSVESLAYKRPLEVVYLLYHGKEGTSEEVNAFKNDLYGRSECKPELLAAIQKLPKTGHPMKLLCAAILLAGMYESTGDYKEDCLNLIAKIPTITATTINYHAGFGGCKPSNPHSGYMENFAEMLNVPSANLAELQQAFKLFDVLHFDHGGGNLSTFVGKAVASGLEDMYGSISSALCALAGPRHGKANQECLEFIQELIVEVGENATPDQVRAVLEKRLENNQLIYGFGHAVLRIEDPRAAVIFEYMNKHYPNHSLVKMCNILRQVGPEVLKKNPKISNPYPNVDLVSGALLVASGFPYPEYFTLLFGLSRTVGIAIQIVYERCEAREGKGTPIVRPKYIYKPRT
ncbi:MAG: citrate (Si)-synthase [Parachlamydiaceae bacterium]